MILTAAKNDEQIPAIVEVSDGLTSQSRHSLVLRGSPPAGKLLIPLERRDVRVVVPFAASAFALRRTSRRYGGRVAATAGHLAVARAGLRRERRRMKEHAWKANPATRTDAHGNISSRK